MFIALFKGVFSFILNAYDFLLSNNYTIKNQCINLQRPKWMPFMRWRVSLHSNVFLKKKKKTIRCIKSKIWNVAMNNLNGAESDVNHKFLRIHAVIRNCIAYTPCVVEEFIEVQQTKEKIRWHSTEKGKCINFFFFPITHVIDRVFSATYFHYFRW